MGIIKILIFIVFSGLFLSACDSSGTQEENSTILSSKVIWMRMFREREKVLEMIREYLWSASFSPLIRPSGTFSLEGEGFPSLLETVDSATPGKPILPESTHSLSFWDDRPQRALS